MRFISMVKFAEGAAVPPPKACEAREMQAAI